MNTVVDTGEAAKCLSGGLKIIWTWEVRVMRWAFSFLVVLGLPCFGRAFSWGSEWGLLLWCSSFSLWWLPLLQSVGSRHMGRGNRSGSCGWWTLEHAAPVVVAQGPSCPEAWGICPTQGSNPCPLHWQGDSFPLYLQGSPVGWALPLILCVYLCVRSHWELLA